MKTIKSRLAGFILFALAGSFSFLTCEIGLGNSVDTKPPTVTITYPPTTVSFIRGSFVVAGKAADETSLREVRVFLTARSGADSGTTFGPWSASVDALSKTWQVTVPQPASDGKYDVTAEAVDSAGRTTSASTAYNIDNTPPVLVVQRPSTKGTLADPELFDAFGSDIKFNGTFYDESGPSRLRVYFFDDNGLPVSSVPYTYEMPPDANWNFTLSESNDQNGLWQALEDALPASGLGTFWYTIALEDAAFEYLDPSETGAALTAGKTGNATNHFYNYLDISSELAVGEAYPKLNDLSRFDQGDASALAGYDTLAAALPSFRISSDPDDFALAENGNFSFEPGSMNPSIEIDSLPISSAAPRATDNTVSPLPNPLIMIYRNKNGDALDLDALSVSLTPFDEDGTTLLTAQRETWTSTDLSIKTIGADLSINFLIDKSQGQYRLDVTAGDKYPHTLTKSYGFRINQGAPTLVSVSPDKSTSSASSVTKINSSGGTFQVVVKGSDDDANVTLALTEGGSVPADAVIVRTESTSGYVTNYTWTITLNVPPSDGDTRTLRFQLSDGLYTSSVREVTYQVDDTPPSLVSLLSPVLKTAPHVAAGKAVVSDSLVNVRGLATGDLTSAILLFTSSAAAPSAASTAGWTAAEVDNALTGSDRGFSAGVPLGAAAEGTYYLWGRFADDTFDATLENYGPVEAVCSAVYDTALPTLTETLVNSSARQYRTGAFSLGGMATDSNALHSLTVAWSLNNGAVTTETVVPAADGSWNFAVAAPSQGIYRYTLTATDAAGKVSALSREVQVDAVAPVVTISGGPNINITTQEYTFRGTVTEADSGVATLEVSMDGGATWVSPEGTSTWYFTYDFLTTNEGPVRQILARAADNAGNASPEVSVNYTIDLANPRATLATSIDGAPITTASNADVTFSGTADDAAVTAGRQPASATLTYSKDGGAAVTVTAGSGATEFNLDPGTGLWTWTLDTALGDGLYNVNLTVVDLANKTASASRSVKIDTSAPTLGIASPQSGQQESTATFLINGIATDGTGVGFPAAAAVEYSFDSSDGSDGTWTAFDAAAVPSQWSGYNWSKTVTLADGEGAKRLYVRSSDRLGNGAAAFVDFYYDVAAPTLGVTGTGSVGSEQVFQTGDFSLDITVSDTNALKSLSLTATRDGISQGSLYSASWTAADNQQNFSHSYPVTASGHTLEGLWVYTFTAVDQANRETEITRTVLIDTTAPTVNISAFAGGYYADTTLSVSGTASDAAAHATSGIDVLEYSVDGQATWHALNGTTVWYKTDIAASALAEGTRTVYVRAADVAGNVSTPTSRTFMADHADPVLAETSVGTTDTRYSNVDVTLGGTLTDTNASAVPTLALTVDGVSAGAVTVTAGSWTYDFDADARAEGTYTLVFTATDAAGRHSSVTRTVALDKTDPAVALSTNLTPWQRLTDVTVGGTASDTAGTVNTGVASVQYSLDNLSWNDLSGTANWVGTITFPESATNTLYLRSIDRAGNVSAVSGPHTVRVDATNPVLTETVPNNTAQTRVDLTFSGSISDNLALDGSAPLTLKRKRNGVSLTDTAITPSGGSWTYTQAVAGNDGNWELSFVARDASGLTTTVSKTFAIDTTAPSITVTVPALNQVAGNASFAISGTSTDGTGVGFDGTDDAEYSWTGLAGSWTAFAGAGWDGYNWSAAATIPGAEGSKTLYLRSTDSLGNVGTASVPFYYDVAAPSLEETTVNTADTQYRNASLLFGGTASDSNYLNPASGLTVRVNGGAVTNIAIDTGDNSWTYTFDTTSLANATYSILFTATDAANRVTTVTRTVVVDKTLPTVSVTTDLSSWLTGTVAIGGSSSDSGGSSLSLVEYQLGGTAGTWIPASLSGGTWTGSLSLSGSSEGSIPLYVRATDRAGNSSSVASATATVLVDHSAPTLTETAVGTSAAQYASTNLALSGKASDTNSINPATGLTVSVDGGAAANVTIDPDGADNVAGNADDNAWSYTYDVAAASGGTHTLVFTATDAAGKTSSLTRTVIVDKTAPVVTMNAVAGYQSGAVSIGGTVTEANLSAVEYQLDSFAGAWTQAGVSGIPASGATWNGSLDFSAASEGAHTVYYRALDLAGNYSYSGTPPSVTVNVDRASPNSTIAASATARGLTDPGLLLRETAFTLSGICDDAAVSGGRLPATAVLTATKDGASLGALTLTTGGAGTGTWTYGQAVNGTTHADDGLYVYTMTVTDVAGKISTSTLTVRIDTTEPSVDIGAPGSGESSSSPTYSISGTSRDTGGVGFSYGGTGTEFTDAEYSLDSSDGIDGTWTALGSLDATINWSAANVSLGATEGPMLLWVRSTDRLGNVGTDSVNFYYDVAAPTLTESADAPYNGVGTSDTQYRNADLVFAGTASDSNYLNPANGLTVRVNGGAAENIAIDTDGADNVAGNADDDSWSYTFDTDARSEGTYTLAFTATDAAGKTTSLTRTVVIDKTVPTVTALTNINGAWLTAGSQALSGTASDTGGSGLSYVEYRVSADNGATWGTWSNLTGTGTFSGTAVFADGNDNRLQVRAVDRAGNASVPSTGSTPRTDQTVWIDTLDPDFDVTSPVAVPVDNGSGSLDITVLATDDTSGPVLLEAKAGSTDFTTGTVYSSAIAAGTATVSVTDLTGLAPGNRKIYLRVTDAAGRRSVVMGQSIIIDQTAPTVTLSSHSDGDTVNKTIAFAGTASDANGLSGTGYFEIQRNTDSAWVVPASGTLTVDAAWSVTGFNTAPYTDGGIYDFDADADEITVRVRVRIMDAAGNYGIAQRSLTVDQDADRPVVTLTNVNVDGTTTLKLINTVYGTVTDDDGVTTFEISENGTLWSAVTVSGGMWSYNASAGDGLKTLYFRVLDSAATTFTTDLADEPFVRYGASTVSAPVTFRVDTVTPEVGSTILVDKLAPFAYEADAYTGTLANNAPFGGSAEQFAVGVTATDANGIQSVSIAIPGVAGSPFTASGTFTNAPIINATDIKRGGVYRIETIAATDFTTFGAASNAVGVSFTATRDGTGADTGTVRATLYTTGAIDVSAAADGYVSLTVTVTDNSALQTTATRTILIDNTDPTVTHQSPVVNSTVNGDIEVKGLADDGLGSGLLSVRYQVGINADLDPDSAAWQNVSSPAPYIAWQINFSGASKIDTYANATYGTAGTGADLGLWLVPIVMRIEDNAGNVTVTDTSNYVLKVDPSGDRPKVTVVYPDPLETNRVMGGIIRVFGSSEDDDGVAGVYMQIDVNNDGSFDASDVASNGTDWYSGGNGQLASGTISWNRSINTAGEFNPATGAIAATSIRNGSVYRIVTVDGTDYTALGSPDNNVGTEFRATSSGAAAAGTGTVNELLRRISFRVRARDINTTPVDGTWVGPYVIDVDQNVPKIGSLLPLELTQGATVQLYQADMWVSGDWTLTGSVDDESGIAAITLAGDITGSLAANPTWFTAGTAGDVGVGNYILNIPLNTVAGSTGDIQFTITALDNNSPQLSSTTTVRVNYDNENPTVTTLTHSGTAITALTPVVQSNNTYTFESSVNESGSGFERVAFYFERNVTPDTGDRVYNPMETRAGNANRTYLTALTMVDGLPRLAISSGSAGFARPDQYTLEADSIVGNLNVRRGGLVRIGGIDRLITAVDHVAGSLQWADPVDVSVTDAYVAYALVVDNLKVETPVYTGGVLTSITNDDGDGLIEGVERSGGLYTWTASIDSRNIPDGPIEIHWVAYDQAGNYATGTVSTSVQNNRPMLAAVTLGTDLDGNGTVDGDETLPAYSALDGLGNEQAEATVASGGFIAKGRTSVDIDVVGGNGILDYVMYLDSDGGTTVTGHDLTNGGTDVYLRDSEVAGINTIDLTAGQLAAVGDTITTVVGAARTFVIRIWDSTEETTLGTDSQYAILTMPIQIDVTDGINPRSVISPFFWTGTGFGNNSLYGGSKANGHIELEADLPAASFDAGNTGVFDLDPKVSGRISLRGTVYDDQRLASIWMFIGSGNASEFTFTNAGTTSDQFDTDGDGTLETLGRTYTRLATFNTGTGLWEPVAASVETEGWSLTLDQAYLDQGGHLVNWRLDWDSSLITGVAAADRQIRIIAVDRRPNASSEAENATGSVTTNNVPSYQVDVVPYIGSIETLLSSSYSLNKSVMSRSSNGRYPIRRKQLTNTPTWETETLRVIGFNLDPSATNLFTVSPLADGLNAGKTAIDASSAQIAAGNVTTVTATREYLVTPNAATASGYLNALVVNGGTYIPTLNNQNDNDSQGSYVGSLPAYRYNREANGLNNDILNDDRYLDLWEFTPVTNTGDVRSLDMEVYGNTLNFAAGHVDDRFSVFSNVTNMSATWGVLRRSYTRYFDNKMAYNGSGTPFTVSQCADTLGVPVNAWSLPSHFAIGRGTTANLWEYNSSNQTGVLFIEANWNGSDLNKLDRVQLPDLKVSGNDTLTRGYLSYYDSAQKLTKFRYFEVGTAGFTAGLSTNVNISGTVSSTLLPYVSANNAAGSYNANDMEQAVTIYNNGSTWNQGYVALAGAGGNSPYSAAGFLSDGTAVVAWYDAVAGSLKLAYNAAPATSFSPYQAFTSRANATPAAGTYTFRLMLNGAYVNGGNDLSVTLGTSTNGTQKHELAYQLNRVISEQYGAFAEVDPVTSRVTVRSFQTGTGQTLALAAPTAGTSLLTTMGGTQAAVDGIGTAWTTRTIDANQAGKYVSLSVDGNDGIHLAYQDTANGDLKYSYLSTPAATPVTVTVDSFQQVGQFIDLTTRVIDVNADGDTEIVPYISYYNMSYADTRYSAKMAYLKLDAINTVADGTSTTFDNTCVGVVEDKFTGTWEVETLPASEVPKQYRVNVGVKTNGDLYVGYQGDFIEYARYRP